MKATSWLSTVADPKTALINGVCNSSCSASLTNLEGFTNAIELATYTAAPSNTDSVMSPWLQVGSLAQRAVRFRESCRQNKRRFYILRPLCESSKVCSRKQLAFGRTKLSKAGIISSTCSASGCFTFLVTSKLRPNNTDLLCIRLQIRSRTPAGGQVLRIHISSGLLCGAGGSTLSHEVVRPRLDDDISQGRQERTGVCHKPSTGPPRL